MNKYLIEKVYGREIIDSRGNTTVEAEEITILRSLVVKVFLRQSNM